jgi:UDP-N-acetylmuramate dehydrogenase
VETPDYKMVIKQNVPLSELTTIQVGGTASVVVTTTSVSEMLGALQQVQSQGLPYRVLGWGSNVIGRDAGYNGVIILNKISGFTVVKDIPNGARVTAGAGESLDTVVARTVEMGLSGIESLSSIPGTVGAAPVQNAGAYGQEIGDHLEMLEAIDTQTMQPVTLSKAECHFTYRDSVFKHNNRRYIITSVTLVLPRELPTPPFYKSLQAYFDEHAITSFSPQVVRDAVIAIRKEKLPSPMLLPNAGSFFKNPIVEATQADALKQQFPDLPTFNASNSNVKLAAGWLIEHAGFKGYVRGPLQTYAKNALVLVNSGHASYSELNDFREHIRSGVYDRFGVKLEQEPEEL